MRPVVKCEPKLAFRLRIMGFLAAILMSPTQAIAQDICTWRPVQNAGINSHQKGAPWCQPGEFMTALDLDGVSNYAPHDSPIVGQALCCTNGPNSAWTRLDAWRPVWQANPLISSHQLPMNGWCAPGSFIVAIDFDGPRNISAYDSPVVGAVLCAYRYPTGGAASRDFPVERAGYISHQPFGRWCPEGWYLTAFDQDSRPGNSPYDSPVIGQAQCAAP